MSLSFINQSLMQVVYATQTGTAFDLALEFYSEFMGPLSSLTSFEDLTQISIHQLYVFFIATAGDGDPPSQMRPFWKKMLTKNFTNLKGLKFAVYGLGDRSYGDSFNLAARKLRQRLMMLEGEEIVEIGLGDEQDEFGYKQTYQQQWKPKLKQYLQEIQWKTQTQPLRNVKFQLRQRNVEKSDKFQILKISPVAMVDKHNVYWVEIRPCQQIKNIVCGDVLNIYPQNSRELVQKAYQYFNGKQLNDLNWNHEKLLHYLASVANLHNNLNRSFFSVVKGLPPLASFISTSIEPDLRKMLAAKLQQLAADYTEYFNYIKRYRRNVMEVIVDFNLQIPLSQFIERVGIIFPRKYSIASFKNQPIQIFWLLVKLEEYEVNKNRMCRGLCTTDLTSPLKQNRIRLGSIIPNGELQFIPSLDNNLILVSLGTGVSPFISILEAARNQKQLNWNIILFHSARTLNQTYLDAQLLNELCQRDILRLYQSITREKVKLKERKNMFLSERRVQIIFEENAQELINFAQEHKSFKIMVCGPKEVKAQIERTLTLRGGLDVKYLRKKKQFCYENW